MAAIRKQYFIWLRSQQLLDFSKSSGNDDNLTFRNQCRVIERELGKSCQIFEIILLKELIKLIVSNDISIFDGLGIRILGIKITHRFKKYLEAA